ncbi:hypothetical protein CEP54_009093 [Fusarium duplospermum]|uniref:Uncharacterized protein n=1 Tax=Fusarium duplospermum TaxID=1325734 RepID=A0A428PSC5_9HYPO|nr:hypothetical protein CEP54_009093 [Fusarium duplospermum]
MADAKKEPTAAEAMLFFSIVKHTRNKADVDWDSVALEAGFKNADVAKVRFGQVKRKLGISTDTGVAPRAPSTPTKKGASKVAKTPRSTTKGKGRGRVKKEEEKPVEAEEDEDQKMEMEQPVVKDEQQDELAPDNTKADPF